MTEAQASKIISLLTYQVIIVSFIAGWLLTGGGH